MRLNMLKYTDIKKYLENKGGRKVIPNSYEDIIKLLKEYEMAGI